MDRLKRKKSMDNPYTLIIIDNRFFVEFKDGYNILNKVELTEEQFNAFDNFELEDKSQVNKDERHKDFTNIYDENFYKRLGQVSSSIEDEFIKKSRYEDLMKAINKLPIIIKRRIKLFYFEKL